MNINYTVKQLHVSDDLKAYAEKKVGKLEKFFKNEPAASVTFSRERDRMTAEVTIKSDGRIFRASTTSKDMYSSIDASVSAIERQIRKNKTRLAKSLRAGSLDLPTEPVASTAPVAAPQEPETEEVFDVIRTKRFPMKPMTVEEAILQMNLLNHSFFAFRNQEDENSFAVVYKRGNGGYGLIEPEE